MLNPRKEHETTYTTSSEEQGYKTTRLRQRTGDSFLQNLQTQKRERKAKTQKMKEKPSVCETSGTARHGTASRSAARTGTAMVGKKRERDGNGEKVRVGGRESGNEGLKSLVQLAS